MSKHLNPLVYIAWILSTIFLCLGLGWAIGMGIAFVLLMGLVAVVDIGNGIITAIAGIRK